MSLVLWPLVPRVVHLWWLEVQPEHMVGFGDAGVQADALLQHETSGPGPRNQLDSGVQPRLAADCALGLSLSVQLALTFILLIRTCQVQGVFTTYPLAVAASCSPERITHVQLLQLGSSLLLSNLCSPAIVCWGS